MFPSSCFIKQPAFFRGQTVTKSQQTHIITTIKIRNTSQNHVGNSYVNIIAKERISGYGIRWEENTMIEFKEMVC